MIDFIIALAAIVFAMFVSPPDAGWFGLFLVSFCIYLIFCPGIGSVVIKDIVGLINDYRNK